MSVRFGVRWAITVMLLAGTATPALAQEPPPDETSTTTTTVDESTTSSTTTTTVGETTTTSTSSTTTTTLGETTTSSTSSTTTTTSSTTTSDVATPLASATGFAVGPATASGATPSRGTQVQLRTPPPPPDDPFVPPVDGQTGRRVVYSKTKQTVWVYDETNTIIKMHRVSGRLDPRDPSPGVYRVWSRSLTTFAINNPSITWRYMIRFATGDRGGNIGFHEIPYQYGAPVQTVDQLGQPLSGGCVRQATADAIWMWNWAHIGTLVVVTP